MNSPEAGSNRIPSTFSHEDISSFERALADNGNGVHKIPLGNDSFLTLRITGKVSWGDGSIPVFFASDRTSTADSSDFWGAEIGRCIAGGFVEIADPSWELAAHIKTGWYIGVENTRTQDVITDALDTMARVWGRELVLVGGADGAFAALTYASRMSYPGSAFIWNTPTDLSSYNRKLVDDYLQAAYPSTFDNAANPSQWQNARRDQFYRAGITGSLLDPRRHRPGRVRRLLYLQNQSDWRTVPHCAPYVETHGLLHIGTGSYMLDSEHCVQICDWGSTHSSLPLDFVTASLRKFLSKKNSAFDLGRRMALETHTSRESLAKAPRDLSWIRESITPAISAEYNASTSTVNVSIDAAFQAGYGGLRFGVQQRVDGKAEQLAWYADKLSISIDRTQLRHEGQLTLVVRDGMNNNIAVLPVSTNMSDSSQKNNSGPLMKAFIYGSCVTRDAFELGGREAVVEYVARSPVRSAFGQIPESLPEGMDLLRLSSLFQRRMVTWDVEKKLPHLLATVPHDVVVLDLIDERLRIMHVGDGYLAVSTEAVAAGLVPHAAATRCMTDPDYMDAWRKAADSLCYALAEKPVVLNRVLWAERDSQGVDLTERFPVRPHNHVLTQMYDYLEQRLGCSVITYPPHVHRADPDHKWGLSPFHFIPEFYHHFMQEFRRITAERRV